MSLVVTWDDGVADPVTYTFNEDALASLESYRLSLTAINPLTALQVPIYASLREFMVAMLVRSMAPALDSFPPSSIATAKAAADAANAALIAAKAAVIASVVTES